MKVLALGGSGGMGRFAVETAMHFENIEQILVADINEASALAFAESMNEKVSGIGLDITNTEYKISHWVVSELASKRHHHRIASIFGPFFL